MTTESRPGPPLLDRPGLRCVPVCHYQMEYAVAVRQEFLRYGPDCVAVEIPSSLERIYLRAVGRLPHLSIILYRDQAGETIYVPVEPTDPLSEAVRSGFEARIRVRCIDLDTDSYPLHWDPFPDPYAVRRLGLGALWEAYETCRGASGDPPPDTVDHQREAAMAWQLQQLTQEHERVLFVCGMVHARRVWSLLDQEQVQPVGCPRRSGVRLYNLGHESAREVMSELPFVAATYERWREGAPARPASPWPVSGKQGAPAEEGPPSRELRLVKSEVVSPDRGPAPDGSSRLPPPRDRGRADEVDPEPLDGLLERGVLEILRRLTSEVGQDLERMLQRSTLTGERPGTERSWRAADDPVSVETGSEPGGRPSLRVISREADAGRPGDSGGGETRGPIHDEALPAGEDRWRGPDRQVALLTLLRSAAVSYIENTGESLALWQIRVLLQFSRSYAFLEGRLLPDFYQLLVSARSAVDDNYSYEVWELGSDYPHIDGSGRYETIEVRGEEIWLGVRKIHFRRRIPDRGHRHGRLPIRRRKRERRPGEWSEQFRLGGICSYPPEDLVLEDYGTYLKKKVGRLLSEEHTRIEPLTTSLKDGIDIKETLRNWHQKKVYVREMQRVRGGVGSVVIVFDPDLRDERYPWRETWWGEHEQESDMAFYATPFRDQVVGPGIGRCEYGALMLTHPPGRLMDVWSDPFYQVARRKHERLLMAAIDYSVDPMIVYVAADPPPSRYVSWARRMGKKVLYIPIGTLSPITLKKVRVFHVLSDRRVRDIAAEYVW